MCGFHRMGNKDLGFQIRRDADWKIGPKFRESLPPAFYGIFTVH